MRKLGNVQHAVLEALKQHGSWSPNVHNWVWDNINGAKRIMDSLVRAGYVTITEEQIERSQRSIGGSSRSYIEERTVYRPKKGRLP